MVVANRPEGYVKISPRSAGRRRRTLPSFPILLGHQMLRTFGFASFIKLTWTACRRSRERWHPI
jgi:hypothetical protein